MENNFDLPVLLTELRNVIIQETKIGIDLLHKWTKYYANMKNPRGQTLTQEIMLQLCKIWISCFILYPVIHLPYSQLVALFNEVKNNTLVFDAFSNLIMEGSLPFPLKRYTLTNLDEKFERLQRYQAKIDHEPYSPQNIDFKKTKDFFPFTFNGVWTCIIHEKSDYSRIDILTDYFTVTSNKYFFLDSLFFFFLKKIGRRKNEGEEK